MNLNKLISISNEFSHVIFNLIFVKYGARNAMLIEMDNFNNDENTMKIFSQICKSWNLHMIPLSWMDYRYIVSKTPQFPENDMELGKALGFLCYDHDFANLNIERVELRISEVNSNVIAYVEVCERFKCDSKVAIKHLKNLCIAFNMAMKMEDLNYSFHYSMEQIISENLLLKHLQQKDMDYVIEHIDDYTNLIYNNFYMNSALRNSATFLEHIDFASKILIDMKDDINSIYANNSMEKAEGILAQIENEYFNNS